MKQSDVMSGLYLDFGRTLSCLDSQDLQIGLWHVRVADLLPEDHPAEAPLRRMLSRSTSRARLGKGPVDWLVLVPAACLGSLGPHRYPGDGLELGVWRQLLEVCRQV
ncbi:MAG: hypothetical protein MUF54_02050, partial [Polyangiaceae bacterium]|nr:hypothetical protein [Polyangiaceae bacterium]